MDITQTALRVGIAFIKYNELQEFHLIQGHEIYNQFSLLLKRTLRVPAEGYGLG